MRRTVITKHPDANPSALFLWTQLKMHSPGHSSAASVTASSRSSGTSAMPALPARFASNLIALLHVGETVVKQRKDDRRDLLAQPITGA